MVYVTTLLNTASRPNYISCLGAVFQEKLNQNCLSIFSDQPNSYIPTKESLRISYNRNKSRNPQKKKNRKKTNKQKNPKKLCNSRGSCWFCFWIKESLIRIMTTPLHYYLSIYLSIWDIIPDNLQKNKTWKPGAGVIIVYFFCDVFFLIKTPFSNTTKMFWNSRKVTDSVLLFTNHMWTCRYVMWICCDIKVLNIFL